MLRFSGQRPRAPSPPGSHRRGFQSLSITTTNQQQYIPRSIGNGSSSSPPQLAAKYPLPIPTEKQAKARKLYRRYQMELALGSSKQEPQSATGYSSSFLGVPRTPGPHSITSHTSSRHRRATSISTSTYDAVTELSSVVSFAGDETQSVQTTGELMSFDGTPVKKPRSRKPLSPEKRAKAALVRHLGSCANCRDRKVPCPLDHHDLASITEMIPQGKRTKSQSQYLNSTTTGGSQVSTMTTIGEQEPSLALSQQATLAGIGGGGAFDDLGPISTTLDIQGPGNFGEIQLPAPASINYIASAVPMIGPNPYSTYQHGALLALGRWDGGYRCHHLDGLCNESFLNDDQLQDHFALVHFEFTRISPPHRIVCSECKHLNTDLNGPCYQCQAQLSGELWVFGNYIRTTVYQPHAPDGQDLQAFGAYDDAFAPIGFSGDDWDLGMAPFGGNDNTGGFGLGDDDLFGGLGDLGDQTYDFNPTSASDAGGSQYHGSIYGGGQRLNAGVDLGCLTVKGIFRQYKVAIILSSLLAILLFRSQYEGLNQRATGVLQFVKCKFEEHFPVMAMVVMGTSFTVSFGLRYLATQHLRRLEVTKLLSRLVFFGSTIFSSNYFGVLPPILPTVLNHAKTTRQHPTISSLPSRYYDLKPTRLDNHNLTPFMKHIS